jgi:hypothetical protein
MVSSPWPRSDPSNDELTVRGAYLAMAPAAWFVLVPLAHGSGASIGRFWSPPCGLPYDQAGRT